MSNVQLYDKLKDYILEEKDDVHNGDIEQWLYDKLLTNMDKFMKEINSESPIKAIQRIINKYPPMDTKLGEEIMRRYRNGENMEEFVNKQEVKENKYLKAYKDIDKDVLKEMENNLEE